MKELITYVKANKDKVTYANAGIGAASHLCGMLFQSAIKLDPEYEEAIYHLGLCYLDRNWNRKAIECFQEALELNPNKMEYQQAVKIYEGISGHIPLEADGSLAKPRTAKPAPGESARARLKSASACFLRRHRHSFHSALVSRARHR